MADYKKFRMVGPVAVYIHKQTGRLATKIDDRRFGEWDSIEQIEAMVAEKYPNEFLDVIQIDCQTISGIHFVKRLKIVWDKDRNSWINADTGQEVRYGYSNIIIFEQYVWDTLQEMIKEEEALYQKAKDIQDTTAGYFKNHKHPERPR